MNKILVVDDNLVNRKLAMAMLQRSGWAVAEVDGGQAALDRLAAEPFQGVLLDISMPGMDGEEVCRRIRATPALASLRVVAYTAHALESERSRIMCAGFDDIVIKPVTIQALMAAFPLPAP